MPIDEGKVKKGGVNKTPITDRPRPPMGQGYGIMAPNAISQLINAKDIDPEYIKIVNEKFWNLI